MHIKRSILLLFALPLILGGCNGGNPDPKPDPEEKREMHNYSIYDKGVTFKEEYWQKPIFNYAPEEDNSNSKGLWIRNDYQGKESYNFAYLAKPKTQKDNYPGIVLVHGGGGTAYYQWAEAWADRGYIALAIDLEGHVPNKNGDITMMPTDLYHPSIYPAPHNSNLGDGKLPEDETWLHYACRSVIIGNSFLHNLEGIDIYNVGVCGVSWGGYITSIVTGYDDRFAFAISIYCTKEMKEAGTPMSEYLKNANGAFDKFDYFQALSLVKTPFNIIVSDNDTWGDVNAFTDMVNLMKNGYMTVKHKFIHSHAEALYALEPYAFANSVINKKEITTFVRNGNEILITNMPEKVNYSFVLTTEETNIKNLKDLRKERTELSGNKISLKLDDTVTYFIVCIEDEQGAVSTSTLFAK